MVLDRSPTFITLGPAGSCHERAVRRYVAFQGLDGEARIELTTDLFDGLERVRREGDGTFLVQCSAHPKVHEITERHFREVFVIDTFIYPTKPLALLSRRDVERPRSLGIVPATYGYVDLDAWDEVVPMISKPIVAEALLRGDVDAGLTHLEHHERHPDLLRLDHEIGEVDTTWVVYGTRKRFAGAVIGIRAPELFGRQRETTAPAAARTTGTTSTTGAPA